MSTWEVDDTSGVGEVEVLCLCVHSHDWRVLKVRQATHKWTHTLFYTNTHRGTDPLSGLAVIHDRAHTGLCWLVSQCPILLGPQFVSTQQARTVSVCVKLFVCVFPVWEKKKWKETGERKEGRGIKAERQQRRRRERHRQENMLPFSLSPVRPALAHTW